LRRILLTGKNGQIGWELQRTLATLGEVVSVDRHAVDLANPDEIRKVVREIKPALIVNAAAYTAVDKAESESDLAMAVNGTAPGILAEEAKGLGATVVHYSTDYVFDGDKQTPYTEEDVPNPLSVYGRSKFAGEQAIQAVGTPHLIFRTSWVYGARRKNFLLTVLRLAREKEEVRIVDDQIGAPTWCRMVAEMTAQVLAQLKRQEDILERGGTYHISAAGKTSWHGFAKEIVQSAKGHLGGEQSALLATHILPIRTSEFPLLAKRPAYSLLSNSKMEKVFGVTMDHWSEGLRLCVEDMNESRCLTN
jgi:dTDP-4-dehydrorhamnose reductase